MERLRREGIRPGKEVAPTLEEDIQVGTACRLRWASGGGGGSLSLEEDVQVGGSLSFEVDVRWRWGELVMCVDATLVRCLLVPATAPLRRIRSLGTTGSSARYMRQVPRSRESIGEVCYTAVTGWPFRVHQVRHTIQPCRSVHRSCVTAGRRDQHKWGCRDRGFRGARRPAPG